MCMKATNLNVRKDNEEENESEKASCQLSAGTSPRALLLEAID